MAKTRSSPPKSPAAARAGTWMALLVATTVGEAANTVRAEVKVSEGLVESRKYRLVVQSYDATDGSLPGRRARPVGSAQRAVTAAELRAGVRVNLLEMRGEAAATEPVLVAWVEAGEPDLEFDGRTARPQPGSMFGLGKAEDGRVHLELDQLFAA